MHRVSFYVLRIQHCQIFYVTSSLVLMFILNSIFYCSEVLYQFCFSFSLFHRMQHCSSIVQQFFIFVFTASIYMLNCFSSLSHPHNFLGYSRSTSRTHPFEVFLVYLFKSNTLGFIHLNPLVGRNIDIA